MNEEDILAALEESVEYSGGFVSSYTLPLATGYGGADMPSTSSNSSSMEKKKMSSSSVPASPLPPLQPPPQQKSPEQLSPSASLPPRIQKSPDIFRSPSISPMLSSPISGFVSHISTNSKSLCAPPDLQSPMSTTSDGTDLVCNVNDRATADVNPSKRVLSFHVSCPSLDTINTNASTPPRSGHNDKSEIKSSPRNRLDNPNSSNEQSNNSAQNASKNPSNNSAHDTSKNPNNNSKRKKKASRKNNLVILPWNTPFRHSKSDISAISVSNQGYYTPTAASHRSPLPPPHPLSHVQSYPPTTHPHYVQSSHRYPQHLHSHSFASDASSSEATPVTRPANVRRDRNFSIDESLIDEERGLDSSYSRHNSCETQDDDPYFQDFDDTLSKDSVNNREGDLLGVNIHMDYIEKRSGNVTPVGTFDGGIPCSGSTNSLLGLDIPQQSMHRNKSSLEYSPATMVTFADVNGHVISPMLLIPTETADLHLQLPPPTTSIQYDMDETDVGSVLSNPPCSLTDDTPPSSPDPLLHKTKKRHHRHQSSLVSCSESCVQSQCSVASHESQNFFNYPNPDPQILQDTGVSPLDSSYSFEEDRSLGADNKAFVQQIHNSGLSSLSFEHVDDTFDRTSMDVEIELVYNRSFDNGSVGGGSVESSGSVMSVEERKEMERTIQVYRKYREKKSRMNVLKTVNVTEGDTLEGEVPQAVPATPVASNKALQQLQMPDLNAIDRFNQEFDDTFGSLEMTPLKTTTSPTVEHHAAPDESNRLGVRETKGHHTSSGWSPYYYIRNRIWWWQIQPKQQPRYDFTYKGFDDVDFDRNNSCCFTLNGRDRFYSNDKFWMRTSLSKLICISCFFLLLGWMFSDGGLQKHQSREPDYRHVHRSRHGYYLYSKDDPLARDSPMSTDDFVNPVRRPEDDDLDFSHVEKYFPLDSQSTMEVDDVFKQFEMEDDIMINSFKPTTGNLVLSGLDNEDDQLLISDVDSIVVLGERHCGIEWLVSRLAFLYPSLNVTSGYPSSKNYVSGEWFQSQEGLEPGTASKHILVVSIFINPHDWFELMRVDPIYAPAHKGMNWKQFLESEWSPNATLPLTSIPDDDDDTDWEDNTRILALDKDGSHSLTSRYEHKADGYYSSILELRADKIRAAVKGSLYRPDVFASIPVRYEDLLQEYQDSSPSGSDAPRLPGIIGLIGRIQMLISITPDAEIDESFFPDPIGCNRHICHPSLNNIRQNAEYISYINDHADWHAEQLVGYSQKKMNSHPKPSVERIVVLGERYSGAEWLVDRLTRCFPNIEVTYGFDSRPGKFFQTPPKKASSLNTLVIALFINPYDWVEKMRRNPINAPAHANMDWEDFVTTPWIRTRSNLDSLVVDTSSEICSFGFHYHEIAPCHTQKDPSADDFPLYELKHTSSGFDATDDQVYSSLLELRSDKIINFLSTVHFPGVAQLIKLRYEDLVWDKATYTDDDTYLTLPFPGIAGLLETIRDRTTLLPDVNAGWILDQDGFFKAEPLAEEDFDEDYVKLIEKHIDWTVEALVGYGP